MPALWESSQRPMFVKTVWLDGFRHAILTRDDPVQLGRLPRRRRPASCASYAGPAARREPGLLTVKQFKQSRLSHSGDQLEECFRKLRLVLTVDEAAQSASDETDTGAAEEVGVDDEATLFSEGPGDADTNDGERDAYDSSDNSGELRLNVSGQPIYEPDHSKPTADMRARKAGQSLGQDGSKEKNDLSERVFHWLDLAGKIDVYFPDAGESARSQARPRHSCPDIQKRSSPNGAARTRLATAGNSILADKCSRVADRSHHPAAGEANTADYPPRTVGPSNTIENYAKLSRPPVRDANICQLSKVGLTGDTSKVLAKARHANYRGNGGDSNQEARQKVAAEMTEVERKYAGLVSRNVIADGYSRAVKRQVHIFMPPVQKRTQASASTTRSDLTVSTGSQLSA